MRSPAVLSALAAATALTVLAAAPATSQSFDTQAPFAFLKDTNSDLILFERGADEPMPPASMAKMMTVLVAFDQIDKGKMSLKDTCQVRPDTWRAWSNQGSTMFLKVNEVVSVSDLLHGIVTASGNDASVVLAECIAGTVDAFAGAMNAMGEQIGLTGSHFTTANGWPDEGEYVTARDLARIAEVTIEDHPKLYEQFYTTKEFTHGETMSGEPITQPNRNPIFGRVRGADGLKTGHTEAAGYGFTGSAERDGRRLVMVVAGLPSMSARRDESTRFLEWGFNAFEGAQLQPGKVLAQAAVYNGSKDTISLTAKDGAMLTLPKAIVSDVNARIVYKSPLPAPLQAGQEVGKLHVKAGDMPEQVIPLVAGEAVEEAGFFTRAINGFKSLIG